MNYFYNIECPICDISTTINVQYDEDEPRHCPMCGEDVESIRTDYYDEED